MCGGEVRRQKPLDVTVRCLKLRFDDESTFTTDWKRAGVRAHELLARELDAPAKIFEACSSELQGASRDCECDPFLLVLTRWARMSACRIKNYRSSLSRHLTIVRSYEAAVQSDSTDDRPRFVQLMADIKMHFTRQATRITTTT